MMMPLARDWSISGGPGRFLDKPLLTDTLRIMLATTSGPNAWSLSPPSPPVDRKQANPFMVSSWNGLNRITGEPERLSVVGHVLHLRLPGGTGDLLKLDDGFFPGILPGDANLDDQVDSTDFNILIANYGGSERRWGLGDFDLDGKVTTLDFNLVAGHFGQSLPPAGSLGAVIPEPATAPVVSLAAALLLRRRYLDGKCDVRA